MKAERKGTSGTHWLRVAQAAAVLVLLPTVARAGDVYVVRFFTDFVYSSSTECYSVGWRDHLLFRNTTNQDLTVTALGTSNGYVLPGPDPLLVPARRNRSLLIGLRFAETGGTNSWTPRANYVFVVNRLDVPAGILVESRGELWGSEPFPCGPATGFPHVFGAIPLPVVRTLTPPGTEQIHLATDLGTERIRTNVGIYNAGLSPAIVTMQVRRACDDSVVETRSAIVPGDTVTQITGFADPRLSGCTLPATPFYSRYVVVVMDQPGFSFVTMLANDLPLRIGVTTSVAR